MKKYIIEGLIEALQPIVDSDEIATQEFTSIHLTRLSNTVVSMMKYNLRLSEKQFGLILQDMLNTFLKSLQREQKNSVMSNNKVIGDIENEKEDSETEESQKSNEGMEERQAS